MGGLLHTNAAFSQEGILLTFSEDVPIPNYTGNNTYIYPDVTVYDTEGMLDPAYPGKIVIPSNPNFSHLEVKANLVWGYSTGAGIRQIGMTVERGGVSIPIPGRLNVKEAAPAGQNLIQHAASAAFVVQPGDIIYFHVLQDSGTTVNILAVHSTWIYAKGVNLR